MSCLICETSLSLIHLPCSCDFCEDCLSSWFLENLSSFDIFQIKCPNHRCFRVFSAYNFLQFLSFSQKNHLEMLLTRRTLALTGEYLPCSNKNCENLAYKSKQICEKPYFCPVCGEVYQKIREKSKGFCRELLENYHEITENAFSGVYQHIFTKQCPNCEISIAKNGGCEHMVCRRCGCEFCWICLENWKIHRGKLCFLRSLAKFMIVFAVFVLGINRFGVKELAENMFFYGDSYYLFFIAMNLAVAYCNLSLFLLFYLPFLLILYSIFY